MRLISERISIDETNNPSIVILGRTERWKESLLLFWVLAWSFCGLVFLYYFLSDNPLQYSVPMLVLLSFWLYFEIKTLHVFLWRRKGFEHLVFINGEFTMQKNLYGKGKRSRFFIDEIGSFNLIVESSKNFFAFMDNSFWVIGGQRIYFDYFGKKQVLGMQLNEIECKKTLSILNGQLKKSKKANKKDKEKTIN
jgi:hypothetical protein